jgi:predicted O-linked N-acetylglucosamine transferase (SPINDLY family)
LEESDNASYDNTCFEDLLEKVHKQHDQILELCNIAGVSSVDEIKGLLLKYRKYEEHSRLKTIMVEKSRNLQQLQKDLATTRKSLQECSKEIDPPGFSDFCSGCHVLPGSKSARYRARKRLREMNFTAVQKTPTVFDCVMNLKKE